MTRVLARTSCKYSMVSSYPLNGRFVIKIVGLLFRPSWHVSWLCQLAVITGIPQAISSHNFNANVTKTLLSQYRNAAQTPYPLHSTIIHSVKQNFTLSTSEYLRCAPKCTISRLNNQKFSGEGAQPPDPSHSGAGRGHPSLHPPTPSAPSALARHIAPRMLILWIRHCPWSPNFGSCQQHRLLRGEVKVASIF